MATALPNNLIKLKHTIVEGRVPTSSLLETGEVALGLFKGQESIWLKNTDNEIVNIRSPRHDLMWGDIFKKFETREGFERALKAGKIRETSIVFIEDIKSIWSDGIYYNSIYSSDELESLVSSLVISVPEGVFLLNSNSTSEEISDCFGGVEGFNELFLSASSKVTPMSGMILPGGGSVPVSICPTRYIKPVKYLDMAFEWALQGCYTTIHVKLINDKFSVVKSVTNIETIDKRLSDLEERVGEGLTWNEVNK